MKKTCYIIDYKDMSFENSLRSRTSCYSTENLYEKYLSTKSNCSNSVKSLFLVFSGKFLWERV